MKRIVPSENSQLVLAASVALWGGSVAVAGWEGVFAKLSPVTLALLALFAVVYAAASYRLDRGLRALAGQTGIATLLWLALAVDGIIAATAIAMAHAPGPWLENLARFPYVMGALFVAPLAVALHIAAFGRVAARKPVRRAPARSPGANRAAT